MCVSGEIIAQWTDNIKNTAVIHQTPWGLTNRWLSNCPVHIKAERNGSNMIWWLKSMAFFTMAFALEVIEMQKLARRVVPRGLNVSLRPYPRLPSRCQNKLWSDWASQQQRDWSPAFNNINYCRGEVPGSRHRSIYRSFLHSKKCWVKNNPTWVIWQPSAG